MDEPIQPLRVAMETPRAADSVVLTAPENLEQQTAEPVIEPVPENPQPDSAAQAEPIEAVDPPLSDPAPAPSLKSRR